MMIKIKKGIVFSYDIERILKGKNALDYDYKKSNIEIPTSSFIRNLRENFEKDTKKIFKDVVVISEDEMLDGLYFAIKSVEGRYPHCITR